MKIDNKLIGCGKIFLGILTCSLFCLTSCTWGFDEVNSSNDKVITDELNKDNMWAGYIKSMQQTLFPEDDNSYQRMDELHGNIYSGYHGEANYWSGNNSTTYVFNPQPGWHNEGFNVVYGAVTNAKYPVPGIMNSWNILRQRVDSTSVVFAIGEVLKVAGMHRAVDMYGPLPYTTYGKTLYTDYDHEETIYKTFFKELDHAIGIMSDYYTTSPNARPISGSDMFYDSDILKWVKFANSLKLRLAMRIRFVEPDLAKTYAQQAVSHQYGVIEDNSGNAVIQAGTVYNYTNPLTMLWQGYGETRMGAVMDSYLNGYKDPRVSKYFSPNASGNYKGARYGYSSATVYGAASAPNFGEGDPLYFMTAAEVYFLRAEGAMRNWNMNGTAGDLYNRGIEMSMAQWGISGSAVTAYINDSTNEPIAYSDIYGYQNQSKPSSITIKWVDSASENEKLERIITQKWIALYPNGQEAWSEFRRTNHPKVFPPVTNQNSAQVPSSTMIRRIPLPSDEMLNNNDKYTDAVTKYLDPRGGDNPGTKLWWDAK